MLDEGLFSIIKLLSEKRSKNSKIQHNFKMNKFLMKIMLYFISFVLNNS